jgi:peptide/nickel transport system ATP-binding protein
MGLLPRNGRIVGGSVTVAGRVISRLKPSQLRSVRGNLVSMVFQDPLTSLNPTMKVGAQVAEPLLLHRNFSRDEIRRQVLESLELVGLPRPRTLVDRYPHELSGGMRQRVVMAMALVCRPKLLIADEPTTALDVTIQSQILRLLIDLKHELGMSMLVVTHDMGVIAGQADRVAVMYAGQIVEEGQVRSVFYRPQHRYTEALLGSIPKLELLDDTLTTIPGRPPDLSRDLHGCRFAERCLYATQTCSDVDPPWTKDLEAHVFRCHHPVDTTPAAIGAWSEEIAAMPVRSAGTVTDRSARDEGSRGARPSMPSSDGLYGGAGRRSEREDRPTVAAPSLGTTSPLLELVGVHKEYPVKGGLLRRGRGVVHAVSGVDLNLERGTTLGLVGESGCGKSTLGRLIVGLENPTRGTVRIAGDDISVRANRDRHRRDLQMMFQDPYSSLDPRMRIGSTLREPLTIQRVGSSKERAEMVRRLLLDVSLPAEAAAHFPHEFSGGQRQRIGLARALALRPRLVVADEPVSGLDVSVRAQILNLMRALQSDYMLTYVVISHDLTTVRYVSDTIGVMYLGKLVEHGPMADVYNGPAHPYTRGLLDAVPVADPDRERAKKVTPAHGEIPSAADPPSGCRFRTRCPFAQPLCAAEEPPMRRFGAVGHQAACHFPLREPAGVN